MYFSSSEAWLAKAQLVLNHLGLFGVGALCLQSAAPRKSPNFVLAPSNGEVG